MEGVIAVARMTLSVDGKTMPVAVRDKLRGTPAQFTTEKQYQVCQSECWRRTAKSSCAT
jgi:hypothetical protein